MTPRFVGNQGNELEMISHGPLTLDVANYKLAGEKRLEYLTIVQARLLAVLMHEPNRVHSIAALSCIEPDTPMTVTALKVRMSRLRQCLSRLGCGDQYLHSVRNVGYIFDPN